MEEEINLDLKICLDFTKLPPSQWGDHFLTLTITDSDIDVRAREMEELKARVRDMIMLSPKDDDQVIIIKRKILLIHHLVSLGLSYSFEVEIEEILKCGFEKLEDLIAEEYDLYTISIIFQVFRTYGYGILADVFKRFKENDGTFKKSLAEDVKGMLSFYEAVHFSTTTDYILHEALSFTLDHLEPLATGRRACPRHVSKHIINALHIPQHQSIQALAAREFISFYEQEADSDETLIKLAKLNFKFLQLHYFQELKAITMWWCKLDYTLNFPANYRERTIESWFAALAMYFEPQFSHGRIMSAKLNLVITVIDDACDTDGSIHQVESLVNCLERWDPDYMENLQGPMKSTFKFVMYLFKEYEEILMSQGRSFVLKRMIEEFKIIARANLELVKWARGGHVPSFDEYVESGGAEIGAYSVIACSMMGLGEICKREDFEWLISRPTLVRTLAAKARLMDDIADFEEDMEKGYTANALNYYMNEHRVTGEEASKEVENMVGDMNKIINEECLKLKAIPHRILLQSVNFGRLVDVLYTADDVFNHREGKLKKYLSLLLVEPMT